MVLNNLGNLLRRPYETTSRIVPNTYPYSVFPFPGNYKYTLDQTIYHDIDNLLTPSSNMIGFLGGMVDGVTLDDWTPWFID